MSDYIYAESAANMLHRLGPPSLTAVNNVSNMVIHNQILGARVHTNLAESQESIMNSISRVEQLSDTTSSEQTAFNDLRLSVLDAGTRVSSDTNVFLHEGNPDVDSNELGLVYPISAQFVVPAPTLFHNIVSLGGTVEDNQFDDWFRNHIGYHYPNRNYAVTTWRDRVHWPDLHWRRDFNVMMLCASSYLSVPGITYTWHRVPRSVFGWDGQYITVNVTFNTVFRDYDFAFITYINNTQYSFEGVPILMYFVTAQSEALVPDKDGNAYMVTIPRLHDRDVQLDNRILELEKARVSTPSTALTSTLAGRIDALDSLNINQKLEQITSDVQTINDTLDTIDQWHLMREITTIKNNIGDNKDKLAELEKKLHDYDLQQTSVVDENTLNRFNGMYLDLFDDIQVLKQNISGIHNTLESEFRKLGNRTAALETKTGLQASTNIDLSDLHLNLPDTDAPTVPPENAIRVLTSRMAALEGLYGKLQKRLLESTPDSTTDPTITHRLDIIEHLQTVQTSHLTRLDNEYVTFAAELKAFQPPTSSTAAASSGDIPWSNLALLQRKVEQMNIELQRKADKQSIPSDMVTLSTFTEIVDMNYLANKVADVLTARLGGKARLASSLINAASHVQQAASEGADGMLRNLLEDLKKMNPGLYDFDGDPRANFTALIRLMCDKINWLTGHHAVSVPQTIDPTKDDDDGDLEFEQHTPHSRPRRQAQELAQAYQILKQVTDMYLEWRNAYDTYWFGHLKYLDTERVKNYLMAGGILDNWLTLFF